MRIFSAKINPMKSGLESSTEWHTAPSVELQKQIIETHVSSFLELYRDFTEAQLGLKPGVTKKSWLTNMIKEELVEVMQGKLFLGTISLQDSLAGFIVCAPVKARHEDFKNDVYISLLAVKPFRDFKTNNKIRIGLGKQLVDSAELRFTDANTITLDTRYINTTAMSFYKGIGFTSTGKRTLGGSNPDHYTGYEKSVMRCV